MVFSALVFSYVKKDNLKAQVERYIFIIYVKSVNGYKMWRLEPREAICFVNMDITFDDT